MSSSIDDFAAAVGLPVSALRGDSMIDDPSIMAQLDWLRAASVAEIHAALGDRSLLELRQSIEDAHDDSERMFAVLWAYVHHPKHAEKIEAYAATRPAASIRVALEPGEVERILTLGRLDEDADPIVGESYLQRWLAQRWTTDEIVRRIRAVWHTAAYRATPAEHVARITREVIDEIKGCRIQLPGSIKSVKISLTIETP